MMFRSASYLAVLFCWLAFAPVTPAAHAQQNAPIPSDPGAQQPTAPAAPSSADQSLPDAPSASAHILPPLEPEGPIAVLDTSMGRITCKFYSKEAPQAVDNFIGLATGSKEWTDPLTHQKVQGKLFYDGTTFHRVIPGFMIQGGDPTGTGTGDAGYFFKDEISPALNFDTPGRLAMANAGPNTNGSQFFITEAAYPSLDQHYTIFGQCDPAGVMVAESIADVPRDGQDKPLEPVLLNKVTIVQDGQAMPPVPAPTATAPAAKAAPVLSARPQSESPASPPAAQPQR